MSSDGRFTVIRSLLVYLGLLVSEVAGPFLLGAYAQGFDTFDELRDRGSDGYPWTWEAALGIGIGAAILASVFALALAGRRQRILYWTLCLAAATIGALIELADLSSTATWAVLLGIPLAGVAEVWASSTAARNTRGPASRAS